MPDFLPVSMQDFLYSGKSDLRTQQIIHSSVVGVFCDSKHITGLLQKENFRSSLKAV